MIFEVFATKIVRKYRGAHAELTNPGRLTIGKNVVIGPGLRVVRGAKVSLGEHVGVGANVTVMADVEIGADSLVSSSVAFIGDDHEFDNIDKPIRCQASRFPAKIVLEGDNLIGFGAVIIGDLRIGHGSVIGAGSVVTKDVPPGSVYAGVPARLVRKR
ncbi:acyltransferase [Flaviflexus equikiangi]|uniref:acyltransferase n=1 Tax=Flaviflexus equikiangi TaxID=2758573 RepID=UPI0015F57EA5|nr:acyltransferase [Flaviflexus equikiangi]